MGFFSKQPSQPPARAGNCIYQGEPFPRAGELIATSGLEFAFLCDREDIPPTWTALVRSIRERTDEPAEERVLINILGTVLAVANNTFTNKLGPAFGLESEASRASAQLRAGIDEIASCRQLLVRDQTTGDAFDFELIKFASMATSKFSVEARREGGWPYPDLWDGDLSLFKF